MNKTLDWKKYILAFLITAFLFSGAFLLSGYLNDRKIDNIKAIQDKISIDLLSSETEFSLLSELSCQDVNSSVLSKELNDLAQKIEWSDANLGTSDEVTTLKKYYSLLQIKDYILMRKIADRCGASARSSYVLYFYTTAENCSECVKQSYVLTALREKYPDLRVYSFDYNLNMSAIHALISIFNVEDTKLPALIIKDKLRTGFQSVEDIEKLFPDLVKAYEEAQNPESATSTATSSKKQ